MPSKINGTDKIYKIGSELGELTELAKNRIPTINIVIPIHKSFLLSIAIIAKTIAIKVIIKSGFI